MIFEKEVAAYKENAIKDALESLEASVTQYTWHTQTDPGGGVGAGTHVTMIPQEDFIDDPANGGYNLLIQSIGTFIRDGIDIIAFYGGYTQLGKDDGVHRILSAEGDVIYGEDGQTPIFQVLTAFEPLLVQEQFYYETLLLFKKTSISVEAETISKTYRIKYDLDEFVSVIGKYDYGIAVQGSPTGSGTFTITPDNPTYEVKHEGHVIASITLAQVYGYYEFSLTFVGSTAYSDAMTTFSDMVISYYTQQVGVSRIVAGSFPDDSESALLLIGNGKDSNHPSNAFSVDWDGSIRDGGANVETDDDTGSIILGNMLIQWGYESITTGSTATSGLYAGSVAVKFKNAYKNNPCVMTTWKGNYANQHSIGTQGLSTTGVTLVGRTSTATSDRTIRWLAIGEKL